MNKLSKKISLSLFGLMALAATTISVAAPTVGTAAPDFSLVDTNGKTVSLEGLKGKTVVLEWTNHQCPFVGKHYGSDNMQTLQKEATNDDVVWVSVISSAEGRQGYVEAAEANQLSIDRGASPTHVVLDPAGDLGRLYAARTTPHMYIIDKKGELVYMGGIDDIASADKADIDKATNYVRNALGEIKAGKAISTSTSRPYGCTVKYSS